MRTRRQFGVAVLGAAALAVLLGLSARPTQAAYMVTLLEQNGNVVATGSGTIDLTGMRPQADQNGLSAYIDPLIGQIFIGAGSSANVYTGFTGPASTGSNTATFANFNSNSGNLVGIDPPDNFLLVPVGYVSGNDLLKSTSTWDNTTFSGLGVTPGTYTWHWGTGAHADSFTLQIGPAAAAVPEPASLTLLGIGAVSLVVAYRRRRRCAPEPVEPRG
jgi:hypothetical protein